MRIAGRRFGLVLASVLAVASLGGCQSLCGGTRGVFCPESPDNPLNDAPSIDAEIAAFAVEPGTPDMRFAPDRGYSGGRIVTFFVLDDPAASCAADAPTPRAQAGCPVVVRDPDGDDLLLEWDLDGNGTYESSQLARGDGADPDSPLFEPQSFLEGVRTTYASPGRVEVRLRVSDFPAYLGAPGQAAKTKLLPVHPFPSEDDRASNQPPTARFSVSPSTPFAGEPVSFDAADSFDPEGQELFYRWELGDGTVFPHDPERPRVHDNDARSLTHVYAAPGSYSVTLSVWDAFVAEGVASEVVRVFERTAENTPPTARFSATPASPFVGQSVRFDASTSEDREGPIGRYEWDLDGDESYETDTGRDPVVTESYGSPGERIVGLRVTDSDGATATAARSVVVRPTPSASASALAIGSPFAAAAQDARALPFAASLRGRPTRGGRGVRRRRGGHTSLIGILGSGSLRARVLTPQGGPTRAERALGRFLAAPWRSRASVRVDPRSGRWSASAVALARTRRGRPAQACLRVRLAGRRGEHPTGSLRVLGGTGAGAGLRGGAAFRFRLERDGSATALGRLRAASGLRRALPRACTPLARRR